MKYESVRCDFCRLELYFSDERGESNFRTIISIPEVKVDGTTNLLKGKHFCSSTCLANHIGTHFISGFPLGEDILKSHAESLGYELKKVEKKEKEGNESKDI